MQYRCPILLCLVELHYKLLAPGISVAYLGIPRHTDPSGFVLLPSVRHGTSHRPPPPPPGGKGFKGRATSSGKRQIGAAKCKQPHNQVLCQPPPPLPTLKNAHHFPAHLPS